MPDVAKNITQIGPSEQVSEPKVDEKSWLRQKGEPALWFMRFQRYRDMGTKRSLRAVVASEPRDEKATKGHKNPAKKSEGVGLSDISVSGAWKRAAKVWNWHARATAYDAALVEKQAAYIRQFICTLPFTSKSYRIIQLSQMATILLGLGEKGGMSLQEYFAYTLRMQSLMRDIAHEMEGMGESTAVMADASATEYLVAQTKKTK